MIEGGLLLTMERGGVAPPRVRQALGMRQVIAIAERSGWGIGERPASIGGGDG